MAGFWITAVATFLGLLATVSLGRDLLRRKRAVPRMTFSPGIVREMSTRHWTTGTSHRGATTVKVEFVVNGMLHVCTTLWLFAGNNHWRNVGTLYDLPAGQEVGLFYDSANPRMSALIVDKASYFPTIIAGVTTAAFAVGAWLAWKQVPGH